jgi:hypothetical protein
MVHKDIPLTSEIAVQKHHNAREVFLTQQVDENDITTLLRPIEVLMPTNFASSDNPDAFLCEYEYDTQWQVRRALHFAFHPYSCSAYMCMWPCLSYILWCPTLL